MTTILHTYGTTTTLPTAGSESGQISRSGYQFGGWFDNNSFSGTSITTIDAFNTNPPSQLYANWKQANITINGSITLQPSQIGSTIAVVDSNCTVLSPFDSLFSTPSQLKSITDDSNTITSVAMNGFRSCSQLTTVSLPECKIINTNGFVACGSLVSAIFPKCVEIGESAFGWVEISGPTIGWSWCSNLTTAIFPECTIIHSYAFFLCQNLSLISFPKCQNICQVAFGMCNNLITASFPMCQLIDNLAFENCRLLQSLYLLSNIVVSLNNSSAFYYTPLSSGGSGKIYVPSSLYSNYCIAPNWSKLKARITSYTL